MSGGLVRFLRRTGVSWKGVVFATAVGVASGYYAFAEPLRKRRILNDLRRGAPSSPVEGGQGGASH